MIKINARRFGKPDESGKERKKKRNALCGVVVFLAIAVLVAAAASIGVEAAIRHRVVTGQEETWAASVASYWGGIIGGIVSGVLSFLGVFYTIRYYKESDAQKERAAVQPFLLVEVGDDSIPEQTRGFELGSVPDDKEKTKIINVSIKNIGNGFAKTLVIHTGYNFGGLDFNKVITVGNCAYTSLVANKDKLKDGLSFGLQYIDSMTNEYIQEYTITAKNGSDSVDIESGYPQLLEK